MHAAPDLREALADKQVFVRVCAALALWRTVQNTEGIDAMIDALEDRAWWARRTYVYNPDTDSWVPMRRTSNAPAWWMEMSSECVSSLGEMGPRAHKAVHSLELVVRYWSGPGQVLAIEALGKVGPDAMAALPALEAAEESRSESIRRTAAEAIERIQVRRVASEDSL
jgi:hypothetical protein